MLFKQEEVGEASMCDRARLERPLTATGQKSKLVKSWQRILKLEEIMRKSDYTQL
jgi:hypothetical protein